MAKEMQDTNITHTCAHTPLIMHLPNGATDTEECQVPQTHTLKSDPLSLSHTHTHTHLDLALL